MVKAFGHPRTTQGDDRGANARSNEGNQRDLTTHRQGEREGTRRGSEAVKAVLLLAGQTSEDMEG
jgi:hypothetical protein